MLTSVSACDIVKERPGFGQTVRPVAGSIVASPVPAAYDPDPDYFFHWFRDSAIVIDAVRLLYEAGHLGAEALTHFADFVRFSLSLKELDGRALVALPHWRQKVTPDFVQYLRGDDLSTVSGDAVVRRHARESGSARSISPAGHVRSMTARRCARWPCCGGCERFAPNTVARMKPSPRARLPTLSACCASTSR